MLWFVSGFLGKNTNTGGIKTKNEWVHATVWDCIIFDEYHFGAWRENAKDLFGKDLEAEKEIEKNTKRLKRRNCRRRQSGTLREDYPN